MLTLRFPGRRVAWGLAGLAAIALLALVALRGPAAAAPAPAGGSTGATGPGGSALQTDLPCYLPGRAVRILARGLPPQSRYSVALDGSSQGSGTVAADGSLRGSLPAPALPRGAFHMGHVVTVASARGALTASFEVTRVAAGFSPAAGDPATLQVRYAIFGFGLGPAAPLDPVPREVYLHYLAPGGGAQRYVADLGRTHGLCGSIPTTRRHHLFPFAPTAGVWHLQFDLSGAFSASSTPRVVRAVRVG